MSGILLELRVGSLSESINFQELRHLPRRFATFLLSAALAVLAALAQPACAQEDKDNIAGPYVPTPWVIVDEMLKLADVGERDVVYDLGSGDGRLVITAAKRHGARGVGVELQTELVELARIEARQQGVENRATFIAGDLFEAKVSEASVVMLYLLPRFVTRLVPTLRAELAPGSRIVSHDYPLSPWPPDKTLSFDVPEKEAISGTPRTVLYFYVVPARVGGRWAVALPKSLLAAPLTLSITQEPDKLFGDVLVDKQVLELRELAVRSDSIRFWLFHRGRMLHFQGKVSGAEMSGEVRSPAGVERWRGHLLDSAKPQGS